MNREIMTNERGERSRIEANLRVAVQQGRIRQGEVAKWRRHYESVGYEKATQAQLRGRLALTRPSSRPSGHPLAEKTRPPTHVVLWLTSLGQRRPLAT